MTNKGLPMTIDPKKVSDAHAYLKKHSFYTPSLVIVGGSGIIPPAGFFDKVQEIPFARIPHFQKPTVPGHRGVLLCGKIGPASVWFQMGRLHHYEGFSWQEILFSLRIYKECGAHTVFLTNAAGGLHRSYRPGDLMVVRDHIHFMGNHPLAGPNDTTIGPRFLDTSALYDAALRALANKAARAKKIRLHHGVYAAVSGPSYETPAESRMLHKLGADAAGMSTTAEALFAHYLEMKVFAVSLIANTARHEGTHKGPSHAGVLEKTREGSARLFKLLKEMILENR